MILWSLKVETAQWRQQERSFQKLYKESSLYHWRQGEDLIKANQHSLHMHFIDTWNHPIQNFLHHVDNLIACIQIHKPITLFSLYPCQSSKVLWYEKSNTKTKIILHKKLNNLIKCTLHYMTLHSNSNINIR